jgi:hypothetical protein
MIAMKHLSTLALAAVSILLAGCLNSTTVINVKPDGSGTIEQSTTMNRQAAAQLQQMMGAAGEGAAAKKAGLFDEEDLRAAAAKMGEGVTFVSATPLLTADAQGTRAIYAFADITKLRLDQKPATPGGGAAGAMTGVPGGSTPENILFQFAKTPAGTSRVTVVFPEGKADHVAKAGQAKAPDQAKAGDPMQAAALLMMKQMFTGLKIAIVLQPVGRIVHSNSPFVQGQQVTLLELDMGQLMADEGMLQKVQAAGGGSFEDMKAALKGAKGVKLNPEREVRVEFAAR